MSLRDNPIIMFFPRTGPNFLEPPFGLIALGTTLKAAGFDVHVIDCRVEDFSKKTKELLHGRIPLFFGVTSMTGPQIFHAIKISKWLKSNFNAPVVWGGLHVTLCGEQAISEDFIDFILRGYADHSIVQFAETLVNGGPLKEIPGITLKPEGMHGVFSHPSIPVVNLEELPMPDWGLVDVNNYLNSNYLMEKTAYLFTSRGCVHSCIFCYSLPVNNKKWQGRTARQIIAEIEDLRARIDFDVIFFHDDNFSVDRKRMKDVIAYLKNSGIRFVLSANCTNIDDSFVELLSGSGCMRLDFAIESGSPAILKKYSKGFTIEDAWIAIEKASEKGIPVNLSFIFGHPDETKAEIYETMEFIDRIHARWPAINILDIKMLTPYPGTAIFEQCLKSGLKEPTSISEWGDFYWNTKNLQWNKEALLCQDLSFISLFAFRHNHLRSKHLFLQKTYNVLHLIEKMRWHRRYFKFPVELRAMHWTLVMYNRLMKILEMSFL